MVYAGTKRRVFVSFHQQDRDEIADFITKWSENEKVFTAHVLGAKDTDELINSSDVSYVMGKVRYDYIKDATVTIVLLGSCTHSRRYIDWEIKAQVQHSSSKQSEKNGGFLRFF